MKKSEKGSRKHKNKVDDFDETDVSKTRSYNAQMKKKLKAKDTLIKV